MKPVPQEDFARLSLDCNPIHIDVSYARDSGYDGRVVHGVNTLLSLLEAMCVEKSCCPPLVHSFEARFMQPLSESAQYLHYEEIQERVNVLAKDTVYLGVARTYKQLSGEQSLFTKTSCDSRLTVGGSDFSIGTDGVAHHTDISIAGLVGRVFEFDYSFSNRLAGLLYKSTQSECGSLVRDLCFISYVVGTHLPGFNSLLSSISYRSIEGMDRMLNPSEGRYYVRLRKFRRNASYCLVEFFESSGRKMANVEAFVRPQILRSALNTNATDSLGLYKDWGVGQSALVIGASGGIGIEVASLLTLYGFNTTATYYKSPEQLGERKKQLEALSRSLNVVRYSQAEHRLPPGSFDIIVDCSTPRISNYSAGRLSTTLYLELTEFYFSNISRIVDSVKNSKATICIPSSSAIDELPVGLTEYAAAKAALEVMIKGYAKLMPNLTFSNPRLGRVATKQTLSVLRVDGILNAQQAAQQLVLALGKVHPPRGRSV